MHCSAYISRQTADRKDLGETYMSKKIKFYKGIYELRNDYKEKLTQAFVAKKLGLELNTYARYERGESTVPADVIVKIAKFYKVKTDYILELADRKR